MSNMTKLGKFWSGRVVVAEFDGAKNPGHIVSFALTDNDEILICVNFANGDRYNVHPDALTLL